MRRITRTTAAVLAAALLLTPAYAEETSGTVPENLETTETEVQPLSLAETIRAQLPEQERVNIPYAGVEARVRKYNATIKSLDLMLQTLKKTDSTKKLSEIQSDLDDQRDELERQREDAKDGISQLAPVVGQFEELLGMEGGSDPALQASVLSLQMNLQSAQGSVDMLDKVLELLDDISDELREAKRMLNDAQKELVQTTEKEIQAAADMLVLCAQNCHITLTGLNNSSEALAREIAAADRRVKEAEAWAELGMLSPIALSQIKNTYNFLVSMQDTLALQEESLAGLLAQLCGYDADIAAQAVDLPQVVPKQLECMNWESDLKEAVANSYSVWNQENTMRQANKAYKDDILGSDDAAKGAEIERDAAIQSVERTLRQLYQSISLKYQQLELAQQALEQEQKNFEVSVAKHEMGMISETQFLEHQDMLSAQEDRVHSAELQLLAVYNQYSWAKRGIT